MEIPEFCTKAAPRVTRKRKSEVEKDPDYDPTVPISSSGRKHKELAESGTRNSRLVGPNRCSSRRKDKEFAESGTCTPQLVEPKRRSSRRQYKGSAESCTPTSQPNNCSSTSSSSPKPVNCDRKRVRRCKDSDGDGPKATLSFVSRPEYSIEDWRVKADARHKALLEGSLTEFANELRDVEPTQLEAISYPVTALDRYVSSNAFNAYNIPKRAVKGGSNNKAGTFDFDELPNFVMGVGRGTPGGPPRFEYNSLWNYNLVPVQYGESGDDGRDPVSERTLYPWRFTENSQPDISPSFLSVVGGFSVGIEELDVRKIAESTQNVQYKPDKYAPLIMRIRHPRATGLIFRTGKVIVSGTKSEKECYLAARKFARVVQKSGYETVKVMDFQIKNVLASAELGFKVRLHHLGKNKSYGLIIYEPELFPGLVIPMEYPQVKVIVFCTGSVLMTGAKSEQDIMTAFNSIYPLIRMYGH